MNTDNINTATKVWRWNLNGLGYSKKGINGPYELAVTQDGNIVADFITTGQLNASIIKTGILKSINYKSGGTGMSINLADGSIDTANFKVNANGEIEATAGTIGGWNIGTNELNNGKVFVRSDGSSTIYTVADLFIIRGYIMEYEGFKFTNSTMRNHYDLNEDGIVDSKDYAILKNLLGLEV